jgi:hypothetical protein
MRRIPRLPRSIPLTCYAPANWTTSDSVVKEYSKLGRAADRLEVPKLGADFTTCAKFFVRLGGAATTASWAAHSVTPVMTSRPNVPIVFVRTKKLEDRKRRDLVVRQDDGRLDPLKWALDQRLANSPCDGASGPRPRVGHTLLATLEVDEAVPKTNVARRAARDARMPATIDVVAAAIRRRNDELGSDLGTIFWYGEVADLTAALVDHPPMHLRTRVGSFLRDMHFGILDQPKLSKI